MKNQWYIIVSQLLFGQNIWQAWLLVFLPTKLSALLKMIFFTSLKTTKITLEIQISEVCDRSVTLVMWHSFINMLFISMVIFYDKLRPQILSVGITANAALSQSFWNLYTIKGKAKFYFGLHHFFWFWSYALHFAKKYLFTLAGSQCFCVLLTYSSMFFFFYFLYIDVYFTIENQKSNHIKIREITLMWNSKQNGHLSILVMFYGSKIDPFERLT